MDLGDNGEGLYLIRAAIDPDDSLLESDETNNLGFTPLCVRGDRAQVLERGRGYSPWVRNKTVIRD